MASDLGRQIAYGIGKETVAGTPVSVSNWINQLSFEVAPKTEYAQNTSAYGVIERVNDSTPLRSWVEGDLEAKLTDKTGGLVLLGAFGSVSTAANADASGTVKDHTFTINQDIVGKTFTLIRKDTVSTRRYAACRFGEWELSMELGDYIKYTAKVMGKAGEATTATVAYTDETEFTPKHMTVKTATTVGGLGAALNIATLESFTLNVNPNIEADNEAGSATPYAFTGRGYEMSFEMTTRYVGTTYEDAFNAGTALALEITASNTDVTIGTSARPKFVFTAPKIKITDWSRTEDNDAPTTQTMTGTIHFSPADVYALRAVLTNLQTAY